MEISLIILGGLVFVLAIYLSAKHRTASIQRAIADEKASIVEDSGTTANVGIFHPDAVTAVLIGVSEDKGSFYYRMLKQGKSINRSKINLANLSKIDLLVGSTPRDVNCTSNQPTTALKATEIASSMMTQYPPDTLKTIQRIALRISFVSETGSVKTLDITSLRPEDDRTGFQRVQLFKNTVWWVAFLNIASRQARHMRTQMHVREDDS